LGKGNPTPSTVFLFRLWKDEDFFLFLVSCFLSLFVGKLIQTPKKVFFFLAHVSLFFGLKPSLLQGGFSPILGFFFYKIAAVTILFFDKALARSRPTVFFSPFTQISFRSGRGIPPPFLHLVLAEFFDLLVIPPDIFDSIKPGPTDSFLPFPSPASFVRRVFLFAPLAFFPFALPAPFSLKGISF